MGARCFRAVMPVSVLALAGLLAGVPFRSAEAAEDCLLVAEVESSQVVAMQGSCASRHSPASTFKVALSLMGFDAGILKSPSDPVWTTQPGLAQGPEAWNGPQDPQGWLRHSVVWYSQLLTRRLGMERLRAYVHGFSYGNEDLAGDPGLDNGLTRAWLSSSLRISPREQVDFLRRMLKGELPVSPEAVDQTVALMKVPERPAGWDLFGKTGTGFLPQPDGTPDRRRPFGWFVGFARKDGRAIVFARFIALDQDSPEPLGPVARRQAVTALEPILKARER